MKRSTRGKNSIIFCEVKKFCTPERVVTERKGKMGFHWLMRLKTTDFGDISLSACMIFAIRGQQSESRTGENYDKNNTKIVKTSRTDIFE